MKKLITSSYLKVLIFVFALTYLFYVLYDRQSSVLAAFSFYQSLLSSRWLSFTVLLLLMPVNWSLEAVKWKLLVKPVQQITFLQSLKSILTGLSLGFVTPHAAGDYAARVWNLRSADRLRSIGVIFLGRSLQFVPTLLFGVYALFIIYEQLTIDIHFSFRYIYFLAAVLILLTLFLLRKKRIRWKREFQFYFGLIFQFPIAAVLYLLLLSFLRFAVFIVQFLILLNLGGVDLPLYIQLAGVSWIFLAKSVLPAFNFLSDLGVREFSAVLFFEHYEVNLSVIVAASLLLWIINIFVPALVGLLFIKQIKFFLKK